LKQIYAHDFFAAASERRATKMESLNRCIVAADREKLTMMRTVDSGVATWMSLGFITESPFDRIDVCHWL